MNYRVLILNRARCREQVEYWFSIYEPIRDYAWILQYKNHVTIIDSELQLAVL